VWFKSMCLRIRNLGKKTDVSVAFLVPRWAAVKKVEKIWGSQLKWSPSIKKNVVRPIKNPVRRNKEKRIKAFHRLELWGDGSVLREYYGKKQTKKGDSSLGFNTKYFWNIRAKKGENKAGRKRTNRKVKQTAHYGVLQSNREPVAR